MKGATTAHGRAEYLLRLTLMQIRHSVRNYSLGVFWWLADPIVNTVILYGITVVVLNRRSEDMALFLLSGLLMFRFLQTAINGACTSLNPALALSSRLYVPKYAFVVRDVLADVLKFFIGAAFLALVIIAMGAGSAAPLRLATVVAVALTFALGAASVVAVVTALVPDFRIVVGYVFRALFFVSGTFFAVDQVPAAWRNLFLLNPFALLVQEFRLAMLGSAVTDYARLGGLCCASLLVAVIGYGALVRLDRKLPKYVL